MARILDAPSLKAACPIGAITSLSDLFCSYPRNGHRDNDELDHDNESLDECGKERDRSQGALIRITDSIYANPK